MSVIFDRRIDHGIITSSAPGDTWLNWKDREESWLFVAAHDDDIIIGAGLTLLAGVEIGVNLHAAVISNGCMGYCTPEERKTISQVRHEETRASFAHLGLPLENLHQFDYDDGNLHQEMGRRFTDHADDSRAIGGAVGLQNTMTWLLREIKPTRIFIPNRLDLHPDHRAVNNEMVISIFHAQGEIWPELGPPIQTLPTLYEYATYSDFIMPPTIQTCVSDDLFEKRLQGIAMFKSQRQINLIVDEVRRAGGNEYLLERAFDIFQAEKYTMIFSR